MNTENVKNADATKNAEAKKKSLEAIKKDLIANKEKYEKQKGTNEGKKLYRFQTEEKKLNFDEQKKKRQKIRSKLHKFVSSILWKFLSDDKDLKKEISDFKSFYKETYLLNDLSLQSLTNSTKDEKCKDIAKMLEIIKNS